MREWGSGAIRHIMFLERDESLFVRIARRARVLLTPNADSLLVTAVSYYTSTSHIKEWCKCTAISWRRLCPGRIYLDVPAHSPALRAQVIESKRIRLCGRLSWYK